VESSEKLELTCFIVIWACERAELRRKCGTTDHKSENTSGRFQRKITKIATRSRHHDHTVRNEPLPFLVTLITPRPGQRPARNSVEIVLKGCILVVFKGPGGEFRKVGIDMFQCHLGLCPGGTPSEIQDT
jgi:hypothetical protein